jgi:hypothetical protein
MESALSPEDTEALITYARLKFAEERWPLSPTLRPIRDALEKLDPKPAPEPVVPRKLYVPSSLVERKKRRR